MSVLNSIGTIFLKTRLATIDSWVNTPQKTQKKILKQIIETAKKTEWGKKYKYDEISSYEDFSVVVPISSYEDIAVNVERMMRGEQNILWPGNITNFAKSSGTTNARSKFIPVSKESFEGNHFKAGKDALALYVKNKPDTKLFSGKNVTVGGSHSYFDDDKKIIVGDVSSLLVQHLPIWAEYVRSPSKEVTILSDWEEKSERMADEIIHKDISAISGVPTWTVHLLNKVLEKSGAQSIGEVWPNFEVFFHGGVSFAPYQELFANLFSGMNIQFQELYNASEGFFAVQDKLEKPGEMLLLLDHGIFYEFISLIDIDNTFPTTYTAGDVKVGESYALCITTESGLARYLIGDVVTIVSQKPLRIKVSGRTKQYINTFGEELMVGNAEEALTYTCTKTNSNVSNFTAGPIFMDEHGNKGGHEWVIEFSKEPVDIEAFTSILDTKLREINSDYDAKRAHNIALALPLVHKAPEGTFYQWMKSRNKIGGQNKVPRLSNTREYLDQILSLFKSI